MAVRIFKLAKEFGMSSKDLIEFLHTQGHRPASHMSNVEDTVASILRDRLKPRIQPDKTPKEKPTAAPKGKAATKAGAPPAEVAGEARKRGEKAGRGGTTVAETTRPARGAKPEAGRPGRAEGEGDWEGRAKEKDREKDRDKERESPRLRRFFPSQEDIYDSGPRFGGVRRKLYGKSKRSRSQHQDGGIAVTERPLKIEVDLPVTVRNLSSQMGVKAQAIISKLWQEGHKLSINHPLDEDKVTALAVEFGVDVTFKKQKDADIQETLRGLDEYSSKAEDLVVRPPVVTFLGHVDHGKTSLLDKIRQTNVTAAEAGGITQHIGAYRVDKGNVHVTFIDTPGHHAFTEMRARGANVTDVAVLVVAADDGVMPQTEEAISHARAAGVPIVVALNKIDKASANPMRCKQQLAALNLQPVEWGGDTEVVEVSATTGQGIDTLLETLSLTSEILELKANPNRPAIGIVLEARSSPSQGVLATLLVRDGTLRVGDCVLCGTSYGRIRGLWVNVRQKVKEAPPSTPVTISGLNRVPEAGDKLYVFDNLEQPKDIVEARLSKKRPESTGPAAVPWPEESVPEVPVILKADVQGSLEALKGSLSQLPSEEVKLKLLHAQVGAINQADVMLADAFGALVLGFNVTADEQARGLAEEKDVDIRHYQVIYQLIDDVRSALQGQLAPQLQEEIHGHAEIRQIFKASRVGSIAGCMVTDGFIARNDQIRLRRGGDLLHTGGLSSLKRFKDDVREVKAGFDCGLKLADYEDIQVGDNLEAFALVEKPREL